ncbi:MAG: GGDEF domain-containing protein, partial [Gammaproteobacteria bacterium]
MRRLLFPLVLIVGALLLRKAAPGIEPYYQPLLGALPYVTLGLAGALCFYFHRAREFTAALALLVVYYLIQMELQTSLVEVRARFIYTAISVLLPFTLLLLMFLPERGLRNRYGMMTVSIVPVQILLLIGIYRLLPVATLADATDAWFPVRPFAAYWLSVYASLGFALAVLAGLFRSIKHDSEFHAALLAVAVTAFITLARFDLPRISVVMFGGAGVILLISLLRSSYEMAYRDELTGLPGRRALNERLKGLGGRYAIAMVDVDHFKKFNDTFGHDAGDDVLKMVAKQIAAVQGGGRAYRYGGEEFSIVFPGKDIEDCRPDLDDMRRSVEKYR